MQRCEGRGRATSAVRSKAEPWNEQAPASSLQPDSLRFDRFAIGELLQPWIQVVKHLARIPVEHSTN